MWITRVSIRNPVFATMVMVGIVVLGLFSYARLRVEQMPDVTLPFVDVETIYPGASPEVVESDVTKPIENAVNTVSGVKRIYSNSREAPKPGVRRVPPGHRRHPRDTGRPRQDCAGATAVPARRQGSAGDPGRDRGQPPHGLACRSFPDGRPARAHVAHRPDHRQGAGKHSRRRARSSSTGASRGRS